MNHTILAISEEEVAQLISPAEVIDTVEKVFVQAANGKLMLGENSFLPSGLQPGNRFIAMPVSLPEQQVLGLKWISIYQDPAPGLPFSHGNVIILNDGRTASPLAVVAADQITTMRTAGGHSVVAARHLANPNPKCLAFIGCGSQGKHGIRGFLEEFPSLEEVRVFAQPLESCRAAEELFGDRVHVRICSTARQAVEGAPLVLVATSSKEVLVHADMIAPGATVLGISAFQDLDPALISRADKWVLGLLEEDRNNILSNPAMSHGVPLSEEQVWAELPQIILGEKPGREREDEIILFSHMGMGAFDVACAYTVLERARQTGLGTAIQL